MAANANKGVRQKIVRRSRQINNFGNVCEIIAAERDYLGTPRLNRAEKIPVRFALQIYQLYRVPGAFRCGGHKLEPERLQPEINLRIHQTTRMDCEHFHFVKTRRLPRSSNIVVCKLNLKTALRFILRMLLGTRA